VSVEANKQLARDFFARFADAMAEECSCWIAGKPGELPTAGPAIELESYGELRNGRVYNNEYHTLLTIRDGKIREVREYLDTQHVLATWFRREE
jgi:hypothetical protein